MSRKVTRVGDHFGHKHSDLRLLSEYRDHLKESETIGKQKEVEQLLKTSGFSRTTYGE